MRQIGCRRVALLLSFLGFLVTAVVSYTFFESSLYDAFHAHASDFSLAVFGLFMALIAAGLLFVFRALQYK